MAIQWKESGESNMDLCKLNLILNKDENNSLLIDFFYSCANEICGHRPVTYEQFVKIGWTKEEYNYVYTVIRTMFKNAQVLSLDKTKLPQEFLDFPHEIQEQILNCLKEKQQSLVNALLKKCSQKNIQTMIDFDWRLKMIMGSSTVASLREPLVQVDLRVMENETENIVDLEMNKDELDNFIKALESAI